jgi:hypothetical protein
MLADKEFDLSRGAARKTSSDKHEGQGSRDERFYLSRIVVQRLSQKMD